MPLLVVALALHFMPAVEFENPHVTVVRIQLAAHAKIPMHEVTPRVVVFLTDAHLRMTFPNGTVKEERWKRGQTGWLDQQMHSGENLGDQPIEFIAVIPKQ